MRPEKRYQPSAKELRQKENETYRELGEALRAWRVINKPQEKEQPCQHR